MWCYTNTQLKECDYHPNSHHPPPTCRRSWPYICRQAQLLVLVYYRSRRWEVSFNLLICHPVFHECWSSVTDESSMQILFDITGLQPRTPVKRHLIGIEWLKTATQWLLLLLPLIPAPTWWWWWWWFGSSSASWSPVVVTICRRLFPDFLLANTCLGFCSKSHRGDGGPYWWSGGENPPDRSFSGKHTTVPFRNWSIRNSTCRSDSPDGAAKSGWNLSIKVDTSGVYTSDLTHPSHSPWLISCRASDACIRCSEKFISCKQTEHEN